MPQGKFSAIDLVPGSMATFTCNDDYHIVGNSSFICGDDGEWHGHGFCGKIPQILLKHVEWLRYFH